MSPLLLGNLMETRFDLLLAALLAWMLYAAVTGRWRLMWILFAAATLTKLIPLALLPALIIWQRHRAGSGRAWRGALGGLALVGVVLLPLLPAVALGHLGPRPLPHRPAAADRVQRVGLPARPAHAGRRAGAGGLVVREPGHRPAAAPT